MNKLIEKQLKDLKAVKVNFDNNTTKIVIPRTKEIVSEALIKGNVYLIELDDNLLQPTLNSTLASNWNFGKTPKYKMYKLEFLDKMGSMYKFNGIAYKDGVDIYTEEWFGWFPEGQFKVIEKL